MRMGPGPYAGAVREIGRIAAGLRIGEILLRSPFINRRSPTLRKMPSQGGHWFRTGAETRENGWWKSKRWGALRPPFTVNYSKQRGAARSMEDLVLPPGTRLAFMNKKDLSEADICSKFITPAVT